MKRKKPELGRIDWSDEVDDLTRWMMGHGHPPGDPTNEPNSKQRARSVTAALTDTDPEVVEACLVRKKKSRKRALN